MACTTQKLLIYVNTERSICANCGGKAAQGAIRISKRNNAYYLTLQNYNAIQVQSCSVRYFVLFLVGYPEYAVNRLPCGI